MDADGVRSPPHPGAVPSRSPAAGCDERRGRLHEAPDEEILEPADSAVRCSRTPRSVRADRRGHEGQAVHRLRCRTTASGRPQVVPAAGGWRLAARREHRIRGPVAMDTALMLASGTTRAG